MCPMFTTQQPAPCTLFSWEVYICNKGPLAALVTTTLTIVTDKREQIGPWTLDFPIYVCHSIDGKKQTWQVGEDGICEA
jgi:hypothetical protein